MFKRGYEFSFAWIFAILIGAVIIFLAIYAAFQFAETQQTGNEAATAKKIGVLLTPLETNLESGKFAFISLREETTLFNKCSPPSIPNPFGSQKLSVAVKADFAKQDSETPGVESTFHNKFIFSSAEPKAKKEFYILSKPLNFPFKIADLTIVWSDQEKFCFVNPPTEVKEEIADLALTNIRIASDTDKCEEDTTVCFSNSACDINVKQTQKEVRKNGKTIYYDKSFGRDENALLFAAIFSDPELYDCQIKRLMARAGNLAELYDKKAENLLNSGKCTGPLAIRNKLFSYKEKAFSISESFSSPDITQMEVYANDITSPSDCPIY